MLGHRTSQPPRDQTRHVGVVVTQQRQMRTIVAGTQHDPRRSEHAAGEYEAPAAVPPQRTVAQVERRQRDGAVVFVESRDQHAAVVREVRMRRQSRDRRRGTPRRTAVVAIELHVAQTGRFATVLRLRQQRQGGTAEHVTERVDRSSPSLVACGEQRGGGIERRRRLNAREIAERKPASVVVVRCRRCRCDRRRFDRRRASAPPAATRAPVRPLSRRRTSVPSPRRVRRMRGSRAERRRRRAGGAVRRRVRR